MQPANTGIFLPKPGMHRTKSGRKIDSAFSTVDSRRSNTQTVYYEAETNANGRLAFVTDIKHRDVRSEGCPTG